MVNPAEFMIDKLYTSPPKNIRLLIVVIDTKGADLHSPSMLQVVKCVISWIHTAVSLASIPAFLLMIPINNDITAHPPWFLEDPRFLDVIARTLICLRLCCLFMIQAICQLFLKHNSLVTRLHIHGMLKLLIEVCGISKFSSVSFYTAGKNMRMD